MYNDQTGIKFFVWLIIISFKHILIWKALNICPFQKGDWNLSESLFFTMWWYEVVYLNTGGSDEMKTAGVE